MFACLYAAPASHAALMDLARDFSPRIEAPAPGIVTLDVGGLRRLLGGAHTIGEELVRAGSTRGIVAHVALASTRTAAVTLASTRAGLTVVPAGQERAWLAPVPIRFLEPLAAVFARNTPAPIAETLSRWGIRTFGDLAALPSTALSERIGQEGLAWQRLARGEDDRPLVPGVAEEPFEESLDLDWPVEALEPLSFVLGRLFEALCDRLERRDRAVAVLHVRLRLVTRETHARSLQLPAPMRDARVLRTLVLLDLESHPAPAGIDRVTIAVDPVPGRIVQRSLLARALPYPEQMSTLLARLTALMGEGRSGSAALVDSYRPGAFEMTPFFVVEPAVPARRRSQVADRAPVPDSTWHQVADRASWRLPALGGMEPLDPGQSGQGVLDAASVARRSRVAIRRFRLPVPARVALRDGRPERVATDRRGLEGGRVEACAGPWRTSGDWWRVQDARVQRALDGAHAQVGWDRDEWDVALADGGIYRIYRDCSRNRWFVDGIVD
jgi:protein ImuB